MRQAVSKCLFLNLDEQNNCTIIPKSSEMPRKKKPQCICITEALYDIIIIGKKRISRLAPNYREHFRRLPDYKTMSTAVWKTRIKTMSSPTWGPGWRSYVVLWSTQGLIDVLALQKRRKLFKKFTSRQKSLID